MAPFCRQDNCSGDILQAVTICGGTQPYILLNIGVRTRVHRVSRGGGVSSMYCCNRILVGHFPPRKTGPVFKEGTIPIHYT